MQLQWPVRIRHYEAPTLKPAGQNTTAEALVQPIILLGSTIMATIACYVLAQDQLSAVFAGRANTQDWLVIILVSGLGVMVDTAMVLAASRLRMHLSRGLRDWPWSVITGTMLLLCLGVEGMTLLYFGYLTSRSSIPVNVQDTVKSIHDVLFFIRNGMPPLIIAFFTTALLPLTIEPADRDRATKASTSLNIAGLQEDLVKVGPLASRAEKIQALADQMALFEHASHATPQEQARNLALITQLRTQNSVLPVVDDEQMSKTEAKNFIQVELTALEERIQTEAHAKIAQMTEYVQHIIGPLQEQLNVAFIEQGDRPIVAIQHNLVPPRAANPAMPKPGTKKYHEMVYAVAHDLLQQDTPLNMFYLARELQQAIEPVQAAIASLKQERVRRLKPGQELAPDPVLDVL